MYKTAVSLAPLLFAVAPVFAAQGDASDSANASSVDALSSSVLERLGSAHRGLLIDEPTPGDVWARGTNWKASFSAAGFEYTPFLGSDAPRNFPVRFDLASVTSGGQPLEFDASPTPRVDGQHIVMERGALAEVYILKDATVEQTFVFDELPARTELRVQMNVSTDLARQPFDGGQRFEHARGHVTYGSALAIDAKGQRLRLEQFWTEDGVEIVVPEVFVANAALPLVIDPVVSTFTVENDGTLHVDVDVAYDAQNDLYMIVYEENFSVSDHDVVSELYAPSTNLVFGPAGIDLSSDRWGDPRVANCYNTETFLCVCAEGAALGSRQVRGRNRDAVTGNVGSEILIGGGLSDDAEPDVGGFGNDTNTSFSFCVVWRRSPLNIFSESAIVAQGVSSFGTLVGSTETISAVPGHKNTKPRISPTTGPTELLASQHRYMVVWQREITSTNRDIYARVVDFDVDTAGHSTFQAYSFSDATTPDVSVQNTNTDFDPDPYFVIVFERLVGADKDIFAIVARDGDADNARSVTAMQDLDVQDEQVEPRIAFEGNDYLVTYGSETANDEFDVYMTVINVVDDDDELRTGVVERRTVLRSLDGSLVTTAIAGSHFDLLGDDSGLALWVANGTNGTDGDVGGAEVREDEPAVIGSQYCAAITNSTGERAWVKASVGAQLTTVHFNFQGSDLPAQTFALPLCSQGNGTTLFPGGSLGRLCLSGAIGRFNNLVTATDLSGNLSVWIDPTMLPTPNSIVPAAAGETWYFQFWFRDVVNGAQASNYTNGIGVTFR